MNTLGTVVKLDPVDPQSQPKQIVLNCEFARDIAARGEPEEISDRGCDGIQR
jgi:hypothetical protein